MLFFSLFKLCYSICRPQHYIEDYWKKKSCPQKKRNVELLTKERKWSPHFTNYEVGSLIVVLHPSQETCDEDATECKGNF